MNVTEDHKLKKTQLNATIKVLIDPFHYSSNLKKHAFVTSQIKKKFIGIEENFIWNV